ncbi:MAG TPA: hypothetical protein VKB10_01410 [Gaiellaceae bacterium]|nr:hypothetical protein [Gaiellaceae bacterium]
MVVVQVNVVDPEEGTRLVERLEQEFAGADAYLDREQMEVCIEVKKTPDKALAAIIDFLHEWDANQGDVMRGLAMNSRQYFG